MTPHITYPHDTRQSSVSQSVPPELLFAGVQGSTPPLQEALELHTILSQSDTNLRQPVGLEEQLLMGRMGSDVGQSMLQMLQARPLQL